MSEKNTKELENKVNKLENKVDKILIGGGMIKSFLQKNFISKL